MNGAFRIVLDGISVSGRHGADPGERDRAQPFIVDLEVVVEVQEDALEATADYGVLADAVRSTVEDESFVLLETLANAVAQAAFTCDDRVMQVVATVHKPRAAQAIGAEDVAVVAVFPPTEEP